MEVSVLDLRFFRMSIGNRNWYGKEYFFLVIYDVKLDQLNKGKE